MCRPLQWTSGIVEWRTLGYRHYYFTITYLKKTEQGPKGWYISASRNTDGTGNGEALGHSWINGSEACKAGIEN